MPPTSAAGSSEEETEFVDGVHGLVSLPPRQEE
jgi:hypothetical protein